MILAQVVGRFGDLVLIRPSDVDRWQEGDWLQCVNARSSAGQGRRSGPSARMLDQLLDEANRAVAEAHAAVVRNFGD